MKLCVFAELFDLVSANAEPPKSLQSQRASPSRTLRGSSFQSKKFLFPEWGMVWNRLGIVLQCLSFSGIRFFNWIKGCSPKDHIPQAPWSLDVAVPLSCPMWLSGSVVNNLGLHCEDKGWAPVLPACSSRNSEGAAAIWILWWGQHPRDGKIADRRILDHWHYGAMTSSLGCLSYEREIHFYFV